MGLDECHFGLWTVNHLTLSMRIVTSGFLVSGKQPTEPKLLILVIIIFPRRSIPYTLIPVIASTLLWQVCLSIFGATLYIYTIDINTNMPGPWLRYTPRWLGSHGSIDYFCTSLDTALSPPPISFPDISTRWFTIITFLDNRHPSMHGFATSQWSHARQTREHIAPYRH